MYNLGINEHFPMVPNNPLRMNLGSICAIQVLSIVPTGMHVLYGGEIRTEPHNVQSWSPWRLSIAIHKLLAMKERLKKRSCQNMC